MRVGLIDVDGHNYPNLPLMKLSAWHKSKGDLVEWYNLVDATAHNMTTGKNMYDVVYMSKVFSFTQDYDYFVFADKIVRGGSGYCISLENGKETYNSKKDIWLQDEIEHIYPDYQLYGVDDKAMGFLTRGCPRGCFFCHVKDKEGRGSYKVADLDEFWSGQKNIELLDPNTLACKERVNLLQQLIDSKAKVEFNQGLDIRLMTDEIIEMLNSIKLVNPHFAWDRYEDKHIILPRLEETAKKLKIRTKDMAVYCLTNFNTTYEQDVERVMILRDLGYSPYIMRYNKDSLPQGNYLNRLSRWCNNRALFWKYPTFEDYIKDNCKGS